MIPCGLGESNSGLLERKEQLSQELFYAGEKGDVEKCKELLLQGADVNWKAGTTLWYRTPLMQAAKEGQTKVCQLYAEYNAEIDAFTVSCYTALILAARNGRTETCLFLLSKGANVNNQTKTGETALMWAAGHGHTNTCKCLINNGAQINMTDCYGITALIRAARDGHAHTVIALLENGADVDLAANLGNKILDAQSWARANKHRDVVGILQTHKNYRSLLKDGADPPTYVPLCACGSVNAGKTTLLTKLQLNAIQRRLALVREQPDTSEDMALRTCGIDIEVINVPGVGEFRKMDMAGHSWAFTSNEYFVGRRTSISMVLFDLRKWDYEVEADLFHHLGLLKARETKRGFLRYRPEVILVATHADKFRNPKVRAKAFFKKMMMHFQAYLNFYPKVLVLDCRNPCSEEFEALRNCLKELREKIIKNSERVPRLCSVLLPHIRSWAKERPFFPVFSWKEFVQKVKEVNKVADDEGVKLIAFYLSESGEIVNDDSPELRDKVVLNVNWLTSHIFGIALAPANFPRSLRSDRVNGMVTKEELQSTFPECPLDQLIELFVRFEVCLPWDEQNLICSNYLFPSHLENGQRDLRDVWPEFDHHPVCCVGRIVECKNTMDTIPQSFFPKLQIRLLKRFGHRSPVWHGGIKIADDVVQILMTLSSNLREVNLCVWAPKGCEERCYAALTFIESLRDRLFDEIAGGTELVHKALSITMLRDKKFAGYLLEEVNRALDEHGPIARVVLEECGTNERALDVKYCGIRRYLYPREHISHLPLKRRKQLASLLDTGNDSNVKSSLGDYLREPGSAVESEDFESSGFGDVISSSPTDRALSVWALEKDHRGDALIEILESMKRFDASAIVSQWLSEVSMHQEAFDWHRMREESGNSEGNCSLHGKRGPTTGPSEHSELEDRGRRTTSPSGGSPPFQFPNKSRAVTVPMDVQREQTYGRTFEWARSCRVSGQCNPSENNDFTQDGELGLSSSFKSSLRLSSNHSFPTEESSSHWGAVGKLSLEETQRHSTTQMVPYPSVRIDLCNACKSCQVKLSLQETEDPKVHSGIEETSHDSQEDKSADLDLTTVAVQVSHSDNKEEQAEEVPLPKPEFGEAAGKSVLTVSSFTTQLIPDLSSRLGLCWKPVALDLGFQSSDLETFEDAVLLRVQANQMLDAWLAENSCLFDCERCGEVLLERLQGSFENAHRADLKDFVQHRIETETKKIQ